MMLREGATLGTRAAKMDSNICRRSKEREDETQREEKEIQRDRPLLPHKTGSGHL
jgi:hypothetical protein